MAKTFQRAIDTLRLAGNAQAAAVMDDLVREQNPLRLRNHSHEVLLDFAGIVVGG